MEQKRIDLISFKAENNRVIKAVALDFEKWEKDNVLTIRGDIGNGKSTLLQMLQSSITGNQHLTGDKSDLPVGFLAESCIMDGDKKIYVGAKVREQTRGDKKGESVFEVFLYEKDNNGNISKDPVIDGVKSTPAKYAEMLTTPLTFGMNDLFCDNQSLHFKMIKKIFEDQLIKLNVGDLYDQIKQATQDRDYARMKCTHEGAFIADFERDGYTEKSLQLMKRIDQVPIVAEIDTMKAKMANVESEFLLAKEKNLSAIKDKASVTKEAIRSLNEKLTNAYNRDKDAYDKSILTKNNVSNQKDEAIKYIKACDFLADGLIQSIVLDIQTRAIDYLAKSGAIKEPLEPNTIPINEEGIVDLSGYSKDQYNKEYETLVLQMTKHKKDYTTENEAEYIPGEKEAEMQTLIDAKNKQLESIEANNKLIDRYDLNRAWIEKCGILDKKIDELKQLYSQVETGVTGLTLVPIEKNGDVKLWLMYDGCQYSDFFKNQEKTPRYLYDYSQTQRVIIGIMLQSALLDKKPKVLRLAVIDDVPMTQTGVKVLGEICRSKNLKLITSMTDDRYDKDNLASSEIIIENGELFFN